VSTAPDAADGGTATPAGHWPGPGEPAIEVFRPGTARMLALLWWALSAFVLLDIALRGRERVDAIVALSVLASDVALYAAAWRPAVRLHRGHVVIAGTVRDVAVRLAAVTGADARGALRIRIGPRTVTTAIVTSSARESRRASVAARQAAAPGFGASLPSRGPRGRRSPPPAAGVRRMNSQTLDATTGATHAGYCAGRIREEAERARTGAVGWAGPSIVQRWVWVPPAVAAALVSAAVVIGTV